MENLPKLWPALNFCAVLGSHGNQFAGVFILSTKPAEEEEEEEEEEVEEDVGDEKTEIGI